MNCEKLVELVVARSEVRPEEPGAVTKDELPEVIRAELEALVDHWLDARVQRYEGWFGKHQGALLVEASRVLSREDEDRRSPSHRPSRPGRP